MNHPPRSYNPAQEKEDLLDEVAQVEKLAASIRARMKRLQGKNEQHTVTSITTRMRRLEMPDQEE